MRLGKLVTLVVLALIGWQHQEAIQPHVDDLTTALPTMQTFIEMRSYRPALGGYIDEHREPPRPLTRWLDRTFPRKGERRASIDRFGSRYMMDRDRAHGWVIRSCGPDRACRNGDDLIVPLRGV